MHIAPKTTHEFLEILQRAEGELVQVMKNREGIAIEKSADQMDEIQFASERDLAIRTADAEFNRLRQVRAALRRVQEGSFGVCIDCEEVIGPKRLAALPWASRCIKCQEIADREEQENGTPELEKLVDAA